MLSWINKLMLLLAGSSGLKEKGIGSVLCVILLFYFFSAVVYSWFYDLQPMFLESSSDPLDNGYNLHLCIF